ncbi:MAG: hypothetical protein K2K70_01620 [Lachnospiraceae bacterium]|nr:hypothetical protein [Lachnospiraceae bacterium]
MYLEVNVTKIVKYVCLAGVSIVAVIFGEKAFQAYIRGKQQEDCTTHNL